MGRVCKFDCSAYCGRNRVERGVTRLKQLRRVATRYDKRVCNYLAWVTLAAAIIWLRPSETRPVGPNPLMIVLT